MQDAGERARALLQAEFGVSCLDVDGDGGHRVFDFGLGLRRRPLPWIEAF